MPRGKRKSVFGFEHQLSKMIGTLQEQRKKHADALASIDDLFAKIGITTHLAGEAAPARRGRPPGKRGPGRPPKTAATAGAPVAKKGPGPVKRGSFTTTGPESILAFVKAAGSKGVGGAEITKHWKKEGRGAGEYVIIGKLVKDKKLKTEKIEGGRGSRYTVA